MVKYWSRLKPLMDEKSISKQALADAIGVSFQAIAKVEAGGSLGSKNNIIAAKYFGVSSDWLATGKGEKKVSNRNLDNHLDLSPHELRLLEIFRSLQSDDMRDIAIKQVSVLVNESSEVRDRAVSTQKEKRQASGR